MRVDTPLGPVWLLPDYLGEALAKKTVQIELMLPDTFDIVAMHTGPSKGGGFVVRAPCSALVDLGYSPLSAAELPVKEGTVWPPISEEGAKIIESMGDGLSVT